MSHVSSSRLPSFRSSVFFRSFFSLTSHSGGRGAHQRMCSATCPPLSVWAAFTTLTATQRVLCPYLRPLPILCPHTGPHSPAPKEEVGVSCTSLSSSAPIDARGLSSASTSASGGAVRVSSGGARPCPRRLPRWPHLPPTPPAPRLASPAGRTARPRARVPAVVDAAPPRAAGQYSAVRASNQSPLEAL